MTTIICNMFLLDQMNPPAAYDYPKDWEATQAALNAAAAKAATAASAPPRGAADPGRADIGRPPPRCLEWAWAA